MDNQHRKIIGYRELNETEIDLMNRVKRAGMDLDTLLRDILTYLVEQERLAPERDATARAKSIQATGTEGPDSPEQRRIWNAEPKRWWRMARTNLQVGLMKLTRAIAQPGFF
jgi:hypothetical protein